MVAGLREVAQVYGWLQRCQLLGHIGKSVCGLGLLPGGWLHWLQHSLLHWERLGHELWWMD